MVLGIVSVFCFGLLLIPPLLAVIFGHVAMDQIARSRRHAEGPWPRHHRARARLDPARPGGDPGVHLARLRHQQPVDATWPPREREPCARSGVVRFRRSEARSAAHPMIRALSAWKSSQPPTARPAVAISPTKMPNSRVFETSTLKPPVSMLGPAMSLIRTKREGDHAHDEQDEGPRGAAEVGQLHVERLQRDDDDHGDADEDRDQGEREAPRALGLGDREPAAHSPRRRASRRTRR